MHTAPSAAGAKLWWALVFLVALFVPLELTSMVGSRNDMTLELSLGLAIISTSLLACTVVAASRMTSLLRAIGVEETIRVHRWLGVTAAGAGVAHGILIFVDDPGNLYLAVPWLAPPRAVAAVTATVGIVALCVLSIFRQRWHRRYDDWLRLHRIITLVTLAATALHTMWLKHLIVYPALKITFAVGSATVFLVLVRRWFIRPLISSSRPYKVERLTWQNERTFTITLVPEGVAQLPVHEAGQFVWLRLDNPFGPGEDHPYTISSSPEAAPAIDITIAGTGDFAQRLGSLEPGTRVYLDGPYGSMTRSRPELGTVMIAAGSGITPMLSLLRTLASNRDRRPHMLIFQVSRNEDFVFLRELSELRRQLRLRIVPLTSRPGPNWVGPGGLVESEALRTLEPRGGWQSVEVFICGPGDFAEGVRNRLVDLGAANELVHSERFDLV